jgi:hypothetical protein
MKTTVQAEITMNSSRPSTWVSLERELALAWVLDVVRGRVRGFHSS